MWPFSIFRNRRERRERAEQVRQQQLSDALARMSRPTGKRPEFSAPYSGRTSSAAPAGRTDDVVQPPVFFGAADSGTCSDPSSTPSDFSCGGGGDD